VVSFVVNYLILQESLEVVFT